MPPPRRRPHAPGATCGLPRRHEPTDGPPAGGQPVVGHATDLTARGARRIRRCTAEPGAIHHQNLRQRNFITHRDTHDPNGAIHSPEPADREAVGAHRDARRISSEAR